MQSPLWLKKRATTIAIVGRAIAIKKIHKTIYKNDTKNEGKSLWVTTFVIVELKRAIIKLGAIEKKKVFWFSTNNIFANCKVKVQK